ncbi:MAG TPA: hypothetical protein PLD62_10510 [Candidatus Cloacimonadota bacterium]|nr:hypothetical protein [Candidatus Cloacimonadota bacterium]
MQFSAWMYPVSPDFDWRKKLTELTEIGIDRIFYEGRNLEPALKAATDLPIEIHKWLWIVNHPDPPLYQEKPELFMVNKKGENCAFQPPYVNYYRWLCPNNPESLEEIFTSIKPFLQIDELAGIHLDYIRYPDVFLPAGLQADYGLYQISEMPEFDYCYCPHCLSAFRAQTGWNAKNLRSSTEKEAWRKFHLDSISHLVQEICEMIDTSGKQVTAAVFPSPSEAARCVRQDWRDWPLDAAFPMLYHTFYHENIDWIGEMIELCRQESRIPLHAGIYLPGLAAADFRKIIEIAHESGAAGVCLFPSDRISEPIKEIIKDAKSN